MKKNIEDNKNKDKEGENKRYVPVVDGGWGWVVVVGSFFIHVFADGIVYSFGILLEVIMKEFNASNTKASMIISLLTGLTLGAGPIASAVTNKFGCRVATISGSLIATAGCAASYYATSVEYLMVSVGCVMGMGFGLMYCPAIVIVTMYFERKRAMATGIAVCGAGIGTILFAPLSEELIKAFSWRTVFAVYAAIVSLCSLCGATFRPLTFVAEEDETNNKGLKNYELDDEKTLLSTVVHQRSGGDLSEKNAISKHSETSTENVSHEKSGQISESTGFITVRDVFYTGSMSELPQDERYRSLLSLNAHTHDKKNSLESASMDDEEEKGSKAREILRTIGKMTDISLLVDPIFLLYAVSNLLTSIAFNSPLVFLPSHATNLGCTPSESARIVSAFGLMNTIGRVVIGLISDRKFPCKYGKNMERNRLGIYVISLTLCGLLTAGVFLCEGYITLSIYSGLFGLTLSSYVCLTSVLLVDLLGIGKLTNAFGLILLFQGVGTVIGPPISGNSSGQLADVTGNYNMSFVFCGISLLVSGLMLIVIPSIQRKRRKQTMNPVASPNA